MFFSIGVLGIVPVLAIALLTFLSSSPVESVCCRVTNAIVCFLKLELFKGRFSFLKRDKNKCSMSETWCFNQFDKEQQCQHVIMTWFILQVFLDIFIDKFKICNHKALNWSNTTFGQCRRFRFEVHLNLVHSKRNKWKQLNFYQ